MPQNNKPSGCKSIRIISHRGRFFTTFLLLFLPVLSFSAELDDERKAEAARYFGEFTALKNSKYNQTPECTAKLEAALALDPDNPKYRYEEIQYRSETIRNLPYPQRVAEWPAQWECCRKFREQFPANMWRKRVMHEYWIVPGLDPRVTCPGTDSFALAEKILAQARIYSLKEESVWHHVSMPPTEASDLKDLNLLSRFYTFRFRSLLYVSYSRWLKDSLQNEYEFFRHAEDYFTKHPEQQKEIEDILSTHWSSLDVWTGCGLHDPDRTKIITEHLNSPPVTEYLNFLSRSHLSHLKRIFIILKNMRKMANGPVTDENYRTGLQELFIEQNRYFPHDWAPNPRLSDEGRQNWNYRIMVMYFTMWMLHSGDTTLFRKELARFQKEYKNIDPWTAFQNAIVTGNAELIKHVETMQSYTYERLTNQDINNIYTSVTNRIFIEHGAFADDRAEELFRKINSSFEIKTGRYTDLPIFRKQPFTRINIFLGAARAEDHTWLLLRKEKYDGKTPPLVLICLHDDGTVREIVKTPIAGDLFEECRGISHYCPASITCDARYIVIADMKRNIHIYDQNTGQWSLIPDASPARITALAIASGRIWGLNSGYLARQDFCMMFSYAINGSDRQIHFSTARSKPQNEPESMRPVQISSLIVSGKNLLFTITTVAHTRVYRFSTNTMEFSCIIEFPFKGIGIDYLWQQKDRVYCFTKDFGERIYQIDPEREKAEWIFDQKNRRYKYDPEDVRPVVLKHTEKFFSSPRFYPWAFHGKMLYGANYTPGAIRLDDVEKSPLLLLPSCACVFETADGVLYLGQYRYFFVREKNIQHQKGG